MARPLTEALALILATHLGRLHIIADNAVSIASSTTVAVELPTLTVTTSTSAGIQQSTLVSSITDAESTITSSLHVASTLSNSDALLSNVATTTGGGPIVSLSTTTVIVTASNIGTAPAWTPTRNTSITVEVKPPPTATVLTAPSSSSSSAAAAPGTAMGSLNRAISRISGGILIEVLTVLLGG
ncbi:hypothetical protein NKR23_g9324 [Pleurostoma richardsiae]|uniref:Uncharacterized protein n=1 Tax=Pleurostoma richardsiae TaxID=41990 RepID=A0AA38RHC5_9PEZI|nr:hypothetical protein NKR23_g9324 [Pleurostoma richardsiae]